jgi:hypothetical protein
MTTERLKALKAIISLSCAKNCFICDDTIIAVDKWVAHRKEVMEAEAVIKAEKREE